MTPGGACATDTWLQVAELAGAHGVQGDVRLRPLTERAESLAALGPLHLGRAGRRVEVRLLRPLAQGWAARVSGVDTREAAQALAGQGLFVPRDALPEPADSDSFYLADLAGLAVEDAQGARLGELVGVADFGAGDLLELRLEAPVQGFGRSVLLPFERALVPKVDIAGGRVVVDLAAWLRRNGEDEGG